MDKKLLHIIGAFVLKFFSRENVSALVDQLLDALYSEYRDPFFDGERDIDGKDVDVDV